MAQDDKHLVPSAIFYSCIEQQYAVREHTVPEHVITHVFEGSLQITEASNTYIIEPGDTVIFRKNHLAKAVKFPEEGKAFRSISIFLTPEFLVGYFAENPVTVKPSTVHKVLLPPHPLLSGLFSSIVPYYEMGDNVPPGIINLKLQEVMSLIRNTNSSAEALLSDFSEPGKIDLAGFMQKNFSFNIPNSQFAYLTGRSIATFKRDFQKIFGTSPQKWLLKKRLEQAHYLIAEQGRKPSEVYLEVGFENLSHFSYAFRKLFSYPPSRLSMIL